MLKYFNDIMNTCEESLRSLDVISLIVAVRPG